MTNLQTSKKSCFKRNRYFIACLLIALTGIAGVLIPYFSKFNNGLSASNDTWGTFGDYVGGTLNPAFSFLALIALIYNISLQLKEIKSARIARARAQKASDEQTETQIKQRFEGTFFALLEQHNKALDTISTPNTNITEHRSAIEMTLSSLTSSNGTITTARQILKANNKYHGHYFRILYQLLKFIATNCPSSDIGADFEKIKITNSHVSIEEKMYSNIVRAFLSYSSTQLLAINCCCEDEQDSHWKYKLLIERYSFLEHMPFGIPYSDSTLLSLLKPMYSERAFGNSDFI
jgi:hypothetical protein